MKLRRSLKQLKKRWRRKKEGSNINTVAVQEMFRMLSAIMKDINPSSFKSLTVATSPFEKSISKPRN